MFFFKFSQNYNVFISVSATVSRCGMIYMEPSQLGWKPLVNCCLNTLPARINGEQKEMIRDLFYWLMDPCLEFIAHQKFMMPASNQHLAKTMITVFNAHLDEWGKDVEELRPVFNFYEVFF